MSGRRGGAETALRRRRWRVYGRRRSDFQSTDRWERWPKFLDTRARQDRLERKEPPRYLLGQRISLGNGSRSIRASSSPSLGTRRTRFTSVLSGTWGASDSVASETLNYKGDFQPGAKSFKADCSGQVVLFAVKCS